jgi:hypothetical protein
MALLPLLKKLRYGILSLKNPSFSAGFEPVNPGWNGKHDNHYTTKSDWEDLTYDAYFPSHACLLCMRLEETIN